MIDSDLFIYLSFALSFGAPMAVAVRELVVMKRGRKGPDGGVLRPDPTPPPLLPGDDDLPPLPPCLIPGNDPIFDREPARGPKVPEFV